MMMEWTWSLSMMKICSCRDGEQIFPYTLITDKQNHYMKIYRRVFRFLGFDPETIEKCLRKSRQEVLHSTKKISERGEYADSSPLELLFEQNFTDVYGMAEHMKNYGIALPHKTEIFRFRNYFR